MIYWPEWNAIVHRALWTLHRRMRHHGFVPYWTVITMATFTLYLIGYGNQLPREFLARLESAPSPNGFLVVDIRARPVSWARAYTAPRVEYLFKGRGHDYIWMHELGNRGDSKDVQLLNEQVGLWALERLLRNAKGAVVLMCAERLSRDCHRRAVAARLAERLAKSGDTLEVRTL